MFEFFANIFKCEIQIPANINIQMDKKFPTNILLVSTSNLQMEFLAKDSENIKRMCKFLYFKFSHWNNYLPEIKQSVKSVSSAYPLRLCTSLNYMYSTIVNPMKDSLD